jgi:serine phosphatase RsbU (regulator of sigma subunit)/Tfp pilus assembly protein PilF
MRYLALILLFVLTFASGAQTHLADSLKAELGKAKEDTAKVKLLNSLCRELRSTPKEALRYGSQAITLATKIRYERGLANAYNNMGVTYYSQGDYTKALDNYINSLRIREKLGDKSAMSKCYNNIGLIYYQQGEYGLASDYYTRSLRIKKELKDDLGVASSLGNLGNVLMGMYNDSPGKSLLDSALHYHSEALKIQEEKDDKVGMAASYNNLGNIYLEQENYEQALHSQLRALVIQKEIGDQSGLAHSYINTGAIYEDMKKYDNAIRYYQDAVLLAKEIDDKPSMQAAYEGLSQCYEKMGEIPRAFDYYKRYTAVKDSILNISSSEQIAEMQAKFDSESKEKQIELLRRQGEIRELEREREQSREKIFRYSIIGGLIVLLVLGALMYNRYKLRREANARLESAYNQIEHKNKEITDSIKYAKRIQQAILPPDDHIRKMFPQSFIVYKPKDIVSGDFYWMERWGTQVLLAAVDCTGHGVPGALMSVVGYNLLNQAVNEHGLARPGLILNALNKGISNTLRQKMEESSVKDGMDIALVSFDLQRMRLEYAGAYNPLYLIRNGQLIEIKGDKFPVGIFIGEEMKHFTNHEMELQPGDTFYIFTDGYADQFGMPGEEWSKPREAAFAKAAEVKGKKFKVRRLQELLLSIQQQSMEEQGRSLNTTIEQWKGELEQVDDILVIGVRV